MNQVEVKKRQIELGACIIGLVNILILRETLGNNGITYLVTAYASFSLVRILISGGIAETLGKILRVRNGKGQYKNVLCIRRRVLLLQCGISVVAALLFGIGASWIAQGLFNVQYSTFLVILLAPALVMRVASAVLVGWFQGEGTELPAAVAAPLRQIMLLGLSLLFVNVLGDYGSKVSALLGDTAYAAMYGGVGVAIAVNVTELLILIFLGLIFMGSKRSMERRSSEGMKQTDSLFRTVRILYGAMWMPMLIQFLEVLPIWSGTLFYRKSVVAVDTFADRLGLLWGVGLTVCGIPVLLICVVLLPLNGKLAVMLKKNDMRSAKGIYQSGLHIGLVHGLFVTVFVAAMAEPLSGIFCKSKAAEAAKILQFGAALILLAVIYFYFSRILLFLGKKYYLLGVLAVSNMINIVLAALLLNTGKVGIMGLLYSAIAAMALGCVLLGVLCFGLLRFRVEWLQIVVIPAGAACVVGLVDMFLGKISGSHLGNLITVILGLVIGASIYWVILLMLRSFREQELQYTPGGKLIRGLGQLLRVF